MKMNTLDETRKFYEGDYIKIDYTKLLMNDSIAELTNIPRHYG